MATIDSTWLKNQKPAKWFRAMLLAFAVSLPIASCTGATQEIKKPAASPKVEIMQPRSMYDGDAFLYYILGQLYIREQNWEEAEKAFSQVVEADKKAIDARIFVSHLAVQRGNINQAVEYTQEVVKLDPEHLKSRMLLASLLTAQKKHQEASVQYEILLENDKNDSAARMLLARSYGFLKDKKRAESTLKPLFKDKKLAWKAYLTLGRVLASIPDLEGATKAFYKAHRLGPEKMQPVLSLGVILQKLNRPAESEKVYRDYLSDYPENKAIHSRLGRLLLNQNDRGGALEEFRAISSLAPDNIQARLTTGLILLSEHKYNEALQELRLAEAAEPGNSTVQYYIGQSLEFLNTPKPAEQVYLKISQEEPFFPEAQLRIAHIETTSDRTDQAIARVENLVKQYPKKVIYIKALSLIQLQAENYSATVEISSKGLALDPEHSELLFNRAMAFDKLNMWAKAEKDLRVYIERNPNDAHALNYLGYTWAEKNIYLEEARKLLERAVRLAPDDGFVADSLGWVLYRLKDYKESLTSMKKAVLLEPKDPTIHEHLGDVLHAMGKKKQAMKIWKKALKLEPKNQKLQDKIKKNSK
jgi:tetratricopeptide (TPR) repeat protein